MSDFRFAEPQLVHLLWLVALLVAGLFWLDRRGSHALGRFVSEDLQARLVSRPTRLRRWLRLGLLGLSAVFLVLALMRPQWGVEFISTPRVGAEIMIALDVSRSMLAEDVAPNRLERAKAEIRDLLGYLDGDQVGLIAFAGRAAVVSPLTPDFGFLRLVLDGLQPGSVRPGGTKLEEPIRKAVKGFGELGDTSRVILLITDGEDHGSFPLDAAEDAAKQGVTILAIGFGDEAGSEIRVTDPQTGARTVLRASDGSVVRSRLDGEMLRDIALATRGAYIPAGTGVLDLESIFDAHIAPLMRGSVNSQGRTVQQEGYQWAVLLGLLALLGSVATQARPASLALAVLLLASIPVAPEANAQTTAAPVSPQVTPAEDESASDDTSEALAKLEIPEDPREAYNDGLAALEAKQLEDAERLLEAARGAAAGDGELRFRSTYNLGWVSVEHADAQMEADPEEALAALERAADWFREAVGIRESSEEARRNLEIVLQRALVLADSLAAEGDRDLTARVEELIEAQRTALGAIRQVVDLVAGSDDPDAVSGLRRVFRAAAIEERKLLSEAASVAKFAGDELDALEEVPEAERSPEDGMRVAQISAVLHYLHRARERIGQARSQLRQRRAEHGFRRAAAGLASLKRARDQLRDPVRVLDSLLADAGQLNTETQALVVSQQGLLAADEQGRVPEVPDWLTGEYLAESQEELAGRAGELQSRLHAGVSAVEDEPPGDPAQALFVEAVRAADPLVAEGHDKMLEAHRLLADGEQAEAVMPQAEAAMRLAQARERFLDLKGLIELTYFDQKRIGAIVDPEEEQTLEQLSEYLSALIELQQSNESRLQRLGPLLDVEEGKRSAELDAAGGDPEETEEQREQQRQLFESARSIVSYTKDAMRATLEGLSGLEKAPELLAETQDSVAQSIKGLTHLRRLFFSIVEHLRETAERQVELNDETEQAVALAESEPEATAQRVGPLVPRQQQLAAVAEQIALSLHEQALAGPSAPPGAPPIDEQQALEATQRLTEAAEHVLGAQDAMVAGADAMAAEPPTFETAREQQGIALEELAQALALLEPPRQQQQQQQQQGEDQQQQQQSGGEGEEQEEAEQRAQEADPSQLLQSVRDREAQRHRERSEREQRGYEPVEKDW